MTKSGQRVCRRFLAPEYNSPHSRPVPPFQSLESHQFVLLTQEEGPVLPVEAVCEGEEQKSCLTFGNLT